MRWSIIRLIWVRELRDQLRDRRTVFMVAILPVLIYPVAGLGMMQLAASLLGQTTVVGVAGLENLHPWLAAPEPATPGGVVSLFACTPPPPGAPLAGVERASLVASLRLAQPSAVFQPLLEEQDGEMRFRPCYLEKGTKPESLVVKRLDVEVPRSEDGEIILANLDRSRLDQRKIDLLLVVPPDFQDRLEQSRRPELYVLTREKDDSARIVETRVTRVLGNWMRDLDQVRLARLGLPHDFAQTVRVSDPSREADAEKRDAESLFGLLVKIFPFVLVLWSLAGALYPAVDLCAGEKERGTMETLLISPAGREEIVWGKFLTIWVFSAATALLNLLSMGLTTWKVAGMAPGMTFSPGAMFWGVLLLLPMSAFFSAVCLAVGAYARSSKEGQYYLMPLFMLTMPLIFLTLVPGVELNPFYSMVPVTGVALLLQRLMGEGIDRESLLYFVPVLAPMVLYSWLALRWAIGQFNREEVLFREAERLDVGLWLRRLFRDKEELPTVGEAFFCFGLIMALRWLAMGLGTGPLLALTGTAQLAFVATPPLFMALLLTTRPRLGLGLRSPPWWALLLGVVLGAMILPPLAELTAWIVRQFPGLRDLLRENNPLLQELKSLSTGPAWKQALGLLVLALLPALCEEIAFRGFILTGLRRAFRPRAAVLLSAFLFAVYQMNVFQFVPHFVLGVVLGLLAVRSGSVLPSILFHLTYNALLIGPGLLLGQQAGEVGETEGWRVALAVGGALASAGVLAVLVRASRT